MRLKTIKPWRQQKAPIVQIKYQDGRLQPLGVSSWYSYWRDPYHLLLVVPWSGFVALIALIYIVTNACFALLYLARPDSIENAQPGSFLDAFFFSVQTLASIGYGAMYPKTVYAHTIVTIEAMTGLVGIAVLTGLAFARFSRPTARVMFSQFAVIAPYDGTPTLMFRMANQRRNQILEAETRVYLMRDEVTVEGQFIRRFYDLPLLRNRTPSFTLSWTALHPINPQSPLYQMTRELLIQSRATIVISLTGLDETVVQSIHARHIYAASEILWDHRLTDIFYDTPDGDRYIDYQYFHDVKPLQESDRP